MILFAEDWAKYPNAIVDLNTRNKSFVRLAALYRAMGIKNHAFVLALHNPLLVGVNPHSKNLTDAQIAMIAVECYENPWYYLREVVRAPAIGGAEPVPIEANRSIIGLYWLFFNHIMQMVIQPRQTGKSFGTDSIMVLLLTIMCINTKINLLTKDDDLRRKNIQRIKEIMSDLPRYLDQRARDDSNNTEEITVNQLGNQYSSHVPQSSPKRAANLGRGLTTSIFHIDEPPFQPNIQYALPAALAAMGAATERSAAEGAPYGVVMTTTAGKRDEKEGGYVYRLLQESAPWTEKFFDTKNQKHLEEVVRRNSRGGVVRVASVFNHRQLGKDDEWLYKRLQDALSEGGDADRDYFNVWTSGNQTNPIPIKVLEAIVASARPPLFEEISNVGGYVIRWYIEQDEIESRMNSSSIVLAMDTSEASGSDDISFILMDTETADVLGSAIINETNLIKFSEFVALFLVRYPRVTAIIERRSTGAMLIDYLLLMLPQHGIDPFKRLFNTIVHDGTNPENEERWREINVPLSRRDPQSVVRYKKCFGYATSGSGEMSRDALYGSMLQLSARRVGHRTYDRQLIDQISGLVVRNGRIDHAPGEHDDMVIGWLLANWLLVNGRNLSFYGIDPSKIFCRLVVRVIRSEQEFIHIQNQQALRERIKQLSEAMVRERDDFISERMEQEMRSLMSQLVFEDNEVVSVDDLVRRAREARRNKLRLQSTHQPITPNYALMRPSDSSGYISRDKPMAGYNASLNNGWWR